MLLNSSVPQIIRTHARTHTHTRKPSQPLQPFYIKAIAAECTVDAHCGDNKLQEIGDALNLPASVACLNNSLTIAAASPPEATICSTILAIFAMLAVCSTPRFHNPKCTSVQKRDISRRATSTKEPCEMVQFTPGVLHPRNKRPPR